MVKYIQSKNGFVIYNIYFFDLKKIENIGPMTNEQEAT